MYVFEVHLNMYIYACNVCMCHNVCIYVCVCIYVSVYVCSMQDYVVYIQL